LKACASSIKLSHNHPSGNLKPSQADISLTRKVKDGEELLDFAVLDHIIMTLEGYYSFNDEGLMLEISLKLTTPFRIKLTTCSAGN